MFFSICRLKFVASADENDIAWLPALRAIIDERRKVIEEKPVPLKRDTSTPVTNHSDDDPGLTMMARTTAEVAEFTSEIFFQLGLLLRCAWK